MARLGQIIEARKQHSRAEPSEPLDPRGQRVLVVYLFSGLGDALLLGPGLLALHKAGAQIGVLAKPLAAKALALFDLPVTLHLDDGSRASIARALQKRRYDVAVDLTHRQGEDARRWLVQSKAPLKIGWLSDDERAEDVGLDRGTYDHRHHLDRHFSRAAIGPLAHLGVIEPELDVSFRAPSSIKRQAGARWASGRGPCVVFVPGGRARDRRWPAENYAALAQELIANRSARVMLVGAPNERSDLAALAKDVGPASIYTGRDLRLLRALIARADLVVSNDTGPIHLAFLMQRPTVGIYGAMSPIGWGPPKAGPFSIFRMGEHGARYSAVAAACEAALTSK